MPLDQHKSFRHSVSGRCYIKFIHPSLPPLPLLCFEYKNITFHYLFILGDILRLVLKYHGKMRFFILILFLLLPKDYISGCVNFSFNCQSVSLLQAYLLLELPSSSLLAGTGGNWRQPVATGPLVFSVVRLDL